MYRDFNQDKLNYLKSLTEAFVEPDMKNLSTLSNPVLDIYNWDGKGEMPTTLKSSDIDDIGKKIAAKSDGDLSKTEFQEMFDKVFGNGEKSEYAPYDSLGDYGYRDTLVENEVYNTTQLQKLKNLYESDDDNTDEENLKKLSIDADELEASRKDVDDEDDEDDDEDDDDDSLNESYEMFQLDENYFDEDADEVLEEDYDFEYDENSPISLLEDSSDELVNLNTLLEQTQLIEDEVDSILGYDELSENSDDFSDVISEADSILYEDDDNLLEDSNDFDSELQDYFDEDII